MKTTGNAHEVYEVIVEKLVYGGAGLARHRGKIVFVPFSVPGDRLLVRSTEEKKSFVRAQIVSILSPGPGRTAAICPHFEKCGGCHWQQLDYRAQVQAKKQILEESFHHQFPQTRDLPITMRACPQPVAYRSRARIQLRGSGTRASVGFFRSGSHTVEDVEYCPLFRDSLNEALQSVSQFKRKVDLDPKPHEMDIACSEEEGSWATARTGELDEGQPGTPLLGARKSADVILKRKVGDFTYLVTASVFFQANDFMVSDLVALVRSAAKSSDTGSALDLFAGVGLFSLPLARQFARVVSVENSPPACKLCLRNAASAGLPNIQAVCSDVSEWLHSTEDRAFDTVVLDPPRTGAGPEVIRHILRMAPRTIVYVSCDPQTLIRDLATIPLRDYRISLVEGLDLFPQTYHFETVVQLERQ